MQTGKASGVGSPVLIVGATTGRDGIGGASFASQELGEDAEEKLPSVQVGDPFMEKLLIEACLEAYENRLCGGCSGYGSCWHNLLGF